MRRAAPVTSAAFPSQFSAHTGLNSRLNSLQTRHASDSASFARSAGARCQPRAARSHRRGTGRRRQLDFLRALHGARAATSRGSAITPPARASSAPAAISSPRRSSRRCSRARSRARSRSSCSPAKRSSNSAPARGALAASILLGELSVPYFDSGNQRRAEATARKRGWAAACNGWTSCRERFRGVMLANEVVDAMPVHALAWTRDGVLERGVCANEGQLAWSDRPATARYSIAAKELDIEIPPSGRYESELALFARAWMRSLGRFLERGAILVIDYGFPAARVLPSAALDGHARLPLPPPRRMAIRSICRACRTSPRTWTSARSRAPRADAGLDVLGYASQAQFLVNCGITDLLAEENPADREALPAGRSGGAEAAFARRNGRAVQGAGGGQGRRSIR